MRKIKWIGLMLLLITLLTATGCKKKETTSPSESTGNETTMEAPGNETTTTTQPSEPTGNETATTPPSESTDNQTSNSTSTPR